MRGRLSRRVERNQDRFRLGNRKKRIARERLMVSEAVQLGARLRMMQLHNSVAGLDYGASYYVPPTVSLPVSVPVESEQLAASEPPQDYLDSLSQS